MVPSADRAYFAAFLDLRDSAVIVVGGGNVAARKAESLLRSGARVTVVAPQVTARLAAWAAEGGLGHRAKRFDPQDLEGAALVVAATSDPRVNAEVAAAAKARAVLVNVADEPALGSFLMPAVVDRGPVQVAITTSGAAPVLARRLAALVATAVLPGHGRLAALAGDYRDMVKRRLPDVAARRAFWERVIDGRAGRAALEGREAEARALLEGELARISHKPPG